MSSNSKAKVGKGGGATATASPPAEGEVAKPSLVDYKTTPGAKALLDDEKRLKAVPTDFSFDEHEPLKKGDFAAEHLYLEWRAGLFDHRAAEYAAKAVRAREEAAKQRQFGDPAVRSKAKRHAKLLEKLKELEADLKAQGVQV